MMKDIDSIKQMAEKHKDPYLIGIYMILNELMNLKKLLEKNE